MSVLSIFLAIPVLAYIAYKTYIYPAFLSPLRRIPGPPHFSGHLFLGQLPSLHGPDICAIQQEWFDQYGGVIRVQAPRGTERLLIADPEVVARVISKGSKGLTKPPEMQRILKLTTGNSVLTMDGAEHQAMRKYLLPAFAPTNLRNQLSTYQEVISGFIAVLSSSLENGKQDKGVVLPMFDWIQRVSLDILCKTLFAYESDAVHDPGDAMARASNALINLQSDKSIVALILTSIVPGLWEFGSSKWLLKNWGWAKPLVPWLEPIVSAHEAMQTIKALARRMVQKKIHGGSEDDMQRKDIMDNLLRARKDEESLSEDEMVDQILAFLVTGQAPASAALSWTLWLLANDLECQARLRDEVGTLFRDGKADYQRMKSLPYLDAVVWESLRVMTSVPAVPRINAEALDVYGTTVPKGTNITFCLQNAGIASKQWGDDAKLFSPKRWLGTRIQSVQSRLAFGHGPRNCLGKEIALMEMKAILVSLIHEFEVSMAYPGQALEAEHLMNYKPSSGMPLRIRKVGQKV